MPTNSSTATGTAQFSYDGTKVSYTVNASGFTSNVRFGHIHIGKAGANGNIVVTLKIPVGGTSTSVIDSFAAPDTTAPKNPDGSSMTLNDVLILMRTGNAYVNIHTVNNGGGEIRGQIVNVP